MGKKKSNVGKDEQSIFHETPYVLIRSLNSAIAKASDSSQLQIEATRYLLFWIVFVLWVLLGNDIIMQRRIASTLERKFVDQSFEHGEQGYITFNDISSIDEFYGWANKVFVPNFFEDNRNFTVPKNDTQNRSSVGINQNHIVVIEQANRALFGIRFRQIMMAKDSCQVPASIVSSNILPDAMECYGPYDPIYEARSAFGKPQTVLAERFDGTQQNISVSPYRWLPSSDTNEPTTIGKFKNYDGSGFVIDLPLNEAKVKNALIAMQYGKMLNSMENGRKDTPITHLYPNSKFLHPQATRAVFVNFGVFNLGLNIHMSCTFLVEFHESGKVASSFYFRGAQFFNVWNVRTTLRIIVNIIQVLGIIYYMWRLLSDVRLGFDYITAWHLLDAISLSLFTMHILSSVEKIIFNSPANVIATEQALNNGTLSQNEGGRGYFSLDRYTLEAYRRKQFIGANMVLCAMRGLRYLQVFENLRIVLRAITSVGGDVMNFLFVFLLIIFAFALGGHVVFGPQLVIFDTLENAILSMINMMDGQIKYLELREPFGPEMYNFVAVYFSTVMLLSYIILLSSMMLGIFLESWRKTYEAFMQKKNRVEEKIVTLPAWKVRVYEFWQFAKAGPQTWKAAFNKTFFDPEKNGMMLGHSIDYQMLISKIEGWHSRPHNKNLQFIHVQQLMEIMNTTSYSVADSIFKLLILKWKPSTKQPHFFTAEARDMALNALNDRRSKLASANRDVSTFEERENGIVLSELALASCRRGLSAMNSLNNMHWQKLDDIARRIYDQRRHINSKLESIEDRVDELITKVS